MSSSTSASPCRRFTLAEIQSATKNFNDKLCVGVGGFGKVYKGRLFSEGQRLVVAIKRLDSMSNQGESEFRAEIELLSQLRHCHLVSLIGYCDEKEEMILVYEYMRHGTLYHHLHKAETPLNWVQRMKIAIGAGRGLDYLHTGIGTHHGIIHRDVKTSNILLDENMAALISDFGLSRIGPTNQSTSFVDASAKGTFGYLDPEYFYTGRLTRKTDVYAFGVLLFELLSGRLPVDIRYGEDECSLVRWAQKCLKERKLDQMVDSNIKGTIFPKCLRGFAQIAGRCLNSVPKERPTMTEVVASLQALLQLQVKPASSSVLTGFTWKIQKYLVSETKEISDELDTSSPKFFENNVEVVAEDLINFIENNVEVVAEDLINFTYGEMERVTNNFGHYMAPVRSMLDMDDLYHHICYEKNGANGHGKLYKGWVNKDDTSLPVVVKELFSYKHFDIEMLKKYRHPNLVKLIGYCLKEEKLLLLYEFMHKGNFYELLCSGAMARLPMETKVKIAVGIARGIVYLNSTEDVSKSELYRHKIMLDEDFTAKLSNYDVTKLVDGCYTPAVLNANFDLDYCYPGCKPVVLQSNLSGFQVLFAEILAGQPMFRWLRENSYYEKHAEECFTSCNKIDSESRMLKIFKDHYKNFDKKFE